VHGLSVLITWVMPVWNTMVVDHESRIVHGNRYTVACAGHSTSAANPYRHQKDRTRWDAFGIHNGTRSSRPRCRPKCFLPRSPRGVRRFCPRFFEMGTTEKHTFWAYFFQSLAGAEADLRANTSIRHTDGGAIALGSEGLPQVAYPDHKRDGCDFNWQQDQALKTVGRKRISSMSTSSGWLIV
jgi:hypothetical protein